MAGAGHGFPPGKAARNEARKLLAAFLNNVAAALALAGFLQPLLGVVRQHQAFSAPDAAISFGLIAAAAILVALAQAVVRRVED